MDIFVKRHQPDRYDKWIKGEDIGPHPEDVNVSSSAGKSTTCQESRSSNERPHEIKVSRHRSSSTSNTSKGKSRDNDMERKSSVSLLTI